MACCSPKCRSIFMLCYGIVGIAVGLLVAAIFLAHPQLRNVHAGIWGFVSFICAGCVSFYGLLRWKFWACLRRVTLMFVLAGAGGTALGTVGFIAYIVLGATDTEEKSLVETFYIAAVWCFMTFKWSMLVLSNAITDDRNPNEGLPRVEGESEGSHESLLPDVNPESP